MFLPSGCVLATFVSTYIADGNRLKSHKNKAFLKVHCHSIQCFYVEFLRSKMATRRILRTWPLFFFFTCSELRDRSMSEHQWASYPCKVIPLSDEIRLWDMVKKVKTNKFPWTMVKNSWNPKQACRAPRIDLELSWSDDRSRLAIFQLHLCISLYSTMYTTIIDRQDTCWACFVWKDARPPFVFPTTKWRTKSLNSVTVFL